MSQLQTGRDEQGRFAAGNPGGPGNLNARRVAHLRRLLLANISDEDTLAVFRKLIDLAKDGDLGAIKLVLQYTIGKPGSVYELDASYLADLPAAPTVGAGSVSDGPSRTVAHASGSDGGRAPSVPPDLMRQIEDAIKMPRPLDLGPIKLPKAANGRH